MAHTPRQIRRALLLALIPGLLGAPLTLLSQERVATGALAGVVVSEEGAPLGESTIRLARTDGTEAYSATSDAEGRFRLANVVPGLYRITGRRIGYREAELPVLRIVAGQTSQIRVTLARSATQLSTVRVVASPTAIDATTTEITRRISVDEVELIPMGRDAASLVELVPGARRGFVWGAAADAANNYQLDGVSVNHPGLGGDYLSPSIDWIESLVVRGLGAGAEYGGFQGGIINAVTKSGSNDFQGALRFNYIAPALTSSNVRPNEEGAEQTMRRELSGELRGPLLRDRLFYFVTGQAIARDVRIPDLTTPAEGDFRSTMQEFTDARGLAKLSFLPALGIRLDALYGRTDIGLENAELNGINDPSSARRYSAPASFYSLAFSRATAGSSLDARIAGFDAVETRLGYADDGVPGIQVFRIGRQPGYQNSIFNDRLEPRSLGGNITWTTRQSLPGGANELVVGAEYTRGWWKQLRTRNGGLTWRPYASGSIGTFDPDNPATWGEIASEWGGEIRLESDVEDAAVFVQDYLTVLPWLTLTPGLRYGRWTGHLTPFGRETGRFRAARHQALDPRIGIVWDMTGRNELVFKAHWGRYHQGMSSFFYDRAEGANAYTNQRFYFQGPTISDPRTVFTEAERDAMRDQNTGFGTLVESILNESGRVENYRQPFVEQAIVGFEKTFGPRWKAELLYTNRINRDIVGLMDLNLANNYSPLTNVSVRHRITFGHVADQNGQELVLPIVWVRNDDLRRELIRRQGPFGAAAPPPPGYTFADIARLTYDPDIVLTTIPEARRRLDQVSFSLRTEQSTWNALWSFTFSNLVGNVGGLTGFGDVTSFASGFGTAVPSFTAGPHVRPNEAINFEGRLPNTSRYESKLWLGSELPFGFQGGTFTTLYSGEFVAPTFEITPRFRFIDSGLTQLVDGTFDGVMGQTVLLESRGYRKYEARVNVDLRLERAFSLGRAEWALTADLFNVFGSDAVIAKNLTINDQVSDDPTSEFAAPRLRVSPRALRLGSRVSF